MKDYKVTFMHREVQGYSISVEAESPEEALKLAKENTSDYDWECEDNDYEGEGVLEDSFNVEGYWENNTLQRLDN